MKKIKSILLLCISVFTLLLISTSKNFDTNFKVVKKLPENSSSFHISQLINNTTWEEKYIQSYEVEYSTKTFLMTKENDMLKVRIEQKNIPNGDIEFVKLSACGQLIDPEYAKFVNSGQSVLEDILFDDNNVIIVHDNPVELSWVIPDSCNEKLELSLKANEYTSKEENHFRFPERGQGNEIYTYKGNAKILVDGKINEVDGLFTPQFSPYWISGTGHPKGNVYFYLNDDNDFIYLNADVDDDNTNEFGTDWIELTAYDSVTQAPVTYRVSDLDNSYGFCDFGLTSKVSYKHQTCEIKIPKNQVLGNSLEFSIQYYGTLSLTITPTVTNTPTNTLAPTSTPVPTNTLAPTNTPLPTNTSAPTNTPKPTTKPVSTNTPKPTVTLTPTLTVSVILTPTTILTPTQVIQSTGHINLHILGPNGSPLTNTNIEIVGTTYTTDENGDVQIKNLGTGQYLLDVTIDGKQYSQSFVLGVEDIQNGLTIRINEMETNSNIWIITIIVLVIGGIVIFLIIRSKRKKSIATKVKTTNVNPVVS